MYLLSRGFWRRAALAAALCLAAAVPALRLAASAAVSSALSSWLAPAGPADVSEPEISWTDPFSIRVASASASGPSGTARLEGVRIRLSPLLRVESASVSKASWISAASRASAEDVSLSRPSVDPSDPWAVSAASASSGRAYVVWGGGGVLAASLSLRDLARGVPSSAEFSGLEAKGPSGASVSAPSLSVRSVPPIGWAGTAASACASGPCLLDPLARLLSALDGADAPAGLKASAGSLSFSAAKATLRVRSRSAAGPDAFYADLASVLLPKGAGPALDARLSALVPLQPLSAALRVKIRPPAQAGADAAPSASGPSRVSVESFSLSLPGGFDLSGSFDLLLPGPAWSAESWPGALLSQASGTYSDKGLLSKMLRGAASSPGGIDAARRPLLSSLARAFVPKDGGVAFARAFLDAPDSLSFDLRPSVPVVPPADPSALFDDPAAYGFKVFPRPAR